MKKILFILLFAGCSEEYQVTQEEPTDHVISMMFDRSPSFDDRTEDAFTYFGRVIKSFTRATSGENTRVLISQVGSDSILFHGSSLAFTRQFSNEGKVQVSSRVPVEQQGLSFDGGNDRKAERYAQRTSRDEILFRLSFRPSGQRFRIGWMDSA